ncbi:MAG: hypothetical protein KDK34_18955, partial [Leptospiraceae bacterium]|nr:hypothetical protein [Leptospiraceae bacterium]
VPVRNAARAFASSHVRVNHRIPGTETDLQYELLRESESTVTLIVNRLPESGHLRINLKSGGRTLDSRIMNGEQSIQFEHLGPGRYILEFSGRIRHSFAIQILA